MTINPIQASDGYVQAATATISASPSQQTFNLNANSSGSAIVPQKFITPVLRIDPQTHLAIYEQRDPNTGTVLNEYPTQKAVTQYQQADQTSTSPLTDKTTNSAPAAASVAQTPMTPVKVGTDTVITAGVTTGPQVEPAGNYTE